jgi:hypothetical protein
MICGEVSEFSWRQDRLVSDGTERRGKGVAPSAFLRAAALLRAENNHVAFFLLNITHTHTHIYTYIY